jgi:hypothetical protein
MNAELCTATVRLTSNNGISLTHVSFLRCGRGEQFQLAIASLRRRQTDRFS